MSLKETLKALNNFPFPEPFHEDFIKSVLLIKKTVAQTNEELKILSLEKSKKIQDIVNNLLENFDPKLYLLSIYQTGSGTSTNMNINEVIAEKSQNILHPNDDVNLSQSSNDTIPTALRISVYLKIKKELLPVLSSLKESLKKRKEEAKYIVKDGKTHLMNATPVTFGQVFSGYEQQITLIEERLHECLVRLSELPQGGTAVGTGINTPRNFSKIFIKNLNLALKENFLETRNHFEAQSMIEAPSELSSILKSLSTNLLKILTDMRLMNSNGGFQEIELKALQAGSSIMPGKVNPVLEEALSMICVQVIGYDASNSIASFSGSFELNTMLPLVAQNLLKSIELLTLGIKQWTQYSFNLFSIREEFLREKMKNNPILITALNQKIGYDLGKQIVEKVLQEKRPLLEVAQEMTSLSKKELEDLLDPLKLTQFS